MHDRAGFYIIFFVPKNWEERPKAGQKQGFFEFIEKFGH